MEWMPVARSVCMPDIIGPAPLMPEVRHHVRTQIKHSSSLEGTVFHRRGARSVGLFVRRHRRYLLSFLQQAPYLLVKSAYFRSHNEVWRAIHASDALFICSSIAYTAHRQSSLYVQQTDTFRRN